MFSAFDHACMARALQLAELGLYSTDPNPRVGCVLARDGSVIGEGWHRQAGGAHAEVFAMNEAGTGQVRGATAYVTLEPCSHQGRTPSCARALIEAGVKRVVAATEDPNPLVDGNGFEMLREAGIQVDTGLARDQAEALNPGFAMRMRQNRPFVRVKLAVSVDGRSALQNGQSKWISGAASRSDVQHWRARSSAILTGIETVLADDPSLNVRLEHADRQPLRVVVDSRWRTPANARILNLPGEVLVAGGRDHAPPEHLAPQRCETLALSPDTRGGVSLPELMAHLADRGCNELQVEAGATLAGSLFREGLVDELLLYQAPILLGSGARDLAATNVLEDMQERRRLECLETTHLGQDVRYRFRVASHP